MSLGSAFEVETLLNIIKDLEYVESEQIEVLILEITSLEKRINGFIQKIRKEDLNNK